MLSTEAEATLYAEIAAGHTTRFAVRRAREAMIKASGSARSIYREATADAIAQSARESHPLAWSQLVLYHRGADHPLSPPAPPGAPRPGADVPQRTFLDAGTRRILTTGFIGRRTELHRLRRRLREGQRVFVLQGLGGLGKSTLALHMVRDLLHAGDDLCPLWCQDAEKAETSEKIAEALVDQLLEYGRKRFGSGWDEVVQQVDRLAGDDPARRFECFLGTLLRNVKRLIVYLDNLESLLVGPGDDGDGPPDPDAFGQWRTPALAALWSVLDRFAAERTSCTSSQAAVTVTTTSARPSSPSPRCLTTPCSGSWAGSTGCAGSPPGREPGWSGAWPDTPGRSSTPTT